jgi:hypothetical protein
MMIKETKQAISNKVSFHFDDNQIRLHISTSLDQQIFERLYFSTTNDIMKRVERKVQETDSYVWGRSLPLYISSAIGRGIFEDAINRTIVEGAFINENTI